MNLVFRLSERRIEEGDEEICKAIVSLSWCREQDIGGLRRERALEEVMKNKRGANLHRVLEEYNLAGQNPLASSSRFDEEDDRNEEVSGV